MEGSCTAIISLSPVSGQYPGVPHLWRGTSPLSASLVPLEESQRLLAPPVLHGHVRKSGGLSRFAVGADYREERLQSYQSWLANITADPYGPYAIEIEDGIIKHVTPPKVYPSCFVFVVRSCWVDWNF